MNKTSIPIAALAILLAAVPAASADNWPRSVDGPIEAATLGLPAKRTFGAVREAFERIAEERWGASTETHVDAVFNELGVTDGSSRTSKCPGATP